MTEKKILVNDDKDVSEYRKIIKNKTKVNTDNNEKLHRQVNRKGEIKLPYVDSYFSNLFFYLFFDSRDCKVT